MRFHLRFIVVSHTVHTIPSCGLRAVIVFPNIVSPLPVVDHHGVRARAIPPFPTFFPSHLRPPDSYPEITRRRYQRVTKPGVRTTPHPTSPKRRSPTIFRLMTLAAELISSSSVGPDNLIWLSSLPYVYSSV